jgi:hypothetical protein
LCISRQLSSTLDSPGNQHALKDKIRVHQWRQQANRQVDLDRVQSVSDQIARRTLRTRPASSSNGFTVTERLHAQFDLSQTQSTDSRIFSLLHPYGILARRLHKALCINREFRPLQFAAPAPRSGNRSASR